jgi:hypothetical protein
MFPGREMNPAMRLYRSRVAGIVRDARRADSRAERE